MTTVQCLTDLPIVLDGQILDQLLAVLGGVLHGIHTGGLLRGRRFQHRHIEGGGQTELVHVIQHLPPRTQHSSISPYDAIFCIIGISARSSQATFINDLGRGPYLRLRVRLELILDKGLSSE